MHSEKELRVGSWVMWRGGFGVDEPKKAKVIAIEVVSEISKKYGLSVDCVPWGERLGVVVDLDNGHWAYGNQIDGIL